MVDLVLLQSLWLCLTLYRRTDISNFSLPRRDEIIIHMLGIGHTYLSHGHLLRVETPPR